MPFDFACPDWWDRLQAGETPIADLPLDFDAAERAVRIFDNLRVPDVIGQPRMAEASGEWVRDIVRAVFGSMETSPEGYETRLVGEAFVLVPKKNAKTTSAAAIAITFMLLNKRHNADMLIIGPTQKIAETAYKQAKGIIEADPEGYLAKRFHIRDHVQTIECRVTGSQLMIKTFSADVLTGCKPIFCIIDEIHVLGSMAKAADVIRQVRGGMIPFREALLLMITTQSDHEPAGVFKSELEYARGVRDGRITKSVRLLPVLYEFPEAIQRDEDKPWLNPSVWALVTPNMGKSIDLDRLQDFYARAKEDGEAEIRAWASQHLNIEIGLALHAARWIGVDYWLPCAEPALTFETLIDRSEVIVGGFDGGGLDDLAALTMTGRCKVSRQWLSVSHAWAQQDVLDRRKDIAPRLRDFEKDGDLTICGHDDENRDFVEATEKIVAVKNAGLLPDDHAIGLDANGVADFYDMLLEAGLSEDQVVAVAQGYRLSSAIWGMERKLKSKTYRHAGSAMMAWVLGNAKSELRGKNIYISKQAAGKAKIDPLVSSFNAYDLMARNPQPSVSYLEKGELVVL